MPFRLVLRFDKEGDTGEKKGLQGLHFHCRFLKIKQTKKSLFSSLLPLKRWQCTKSTLNLGRLQAGVPPALHYTFLRNPLALPCFPVASLWLQEISPTIAGH